MQLKPKPQVQTVKDVEISEALVQFQWGRFTSLPGAPGSNVTHFSHHSSIQPSY